MLGTPEARVVCTVTANTPGTSFTLTPVAGERDPGHGITTIVVNSTNNPNRVRVGERVEVRLSTLGG